MPAWIEKRKEHILRKGDLQKKYGPEKAKQIAWAIATQQSHALGKTPKTWGTEEGRRTAREKYDDPSSMKKTPNPKESAEGCRFPDTTSEQIAVRREKNKKLREARRKGSLGGPWRKVRDEERKEQHEKISTAFADELTRILKEGSVLSHAAHVISGKAGSILAEPRKASQVSTSKGKNIPVTKKKTKVPTYGGTTVPSNEHLR